MTALKLQAKQLKLYFVIFVLSILYGCTETTYKKYDFDDISQEYKGGVVKVRFLGTEYSEENLNIRKGLYKIIVTINAKSSDVEKATITKLSIDNGGKIIFQARDLIGSFKKFNDGSLNAQFQITDVDLKPISYDFNLDFNNGGSETYKINGRVSPKYTEQKSNSILERLLGV